MLTHRNQSYGCFLSIVHCVESRLILTVTLMLPNKQKMSSLIQSFIKQLLLLHQNDEVALKLSTEIIKRKRVFCQTRRFKYFCKPPIHIVLCCALSGGGKTYNVLLTQLCNLPVVARAM